MPNFCKQTVSLWKWDPGEGGWNSPWTSPHSHPTAYLQPQFCAVFPPRVVCWSCGLYNLTIWRSWNMQENIGYWIWQCDHTTKPIQSEGWGHCPPSEWVNRRGMILAVQFNLPLGWCKLLASIQRCWLGSISQEGGAWSLAIRLQCPVRAVWLAQICTY